MELNIPKIKRKHYIMKKIDLTQCEKERKLIEDKFSDPNKYFEIDDKVFIGKEIKPKWTDDTLRKMLTISSKRNSIKYKQTTSSLINSTTSNNSKNIKKEKSIIINDKALDEIFDRYRNLKKVNKVNDFLNYIDVRVKRDVSHDLIAQEKALQLREKTEKQYSLIIDKIRNKTKKTQDAILMNSIYEYRTKRELQDIIQKDDNYTPNNSWMISLRRPENFEGERYSYINMRDDVNPYWQMVKEKNTKEIEFIKVPRLVKSVDITRNEYLCKSITGLGLNYENSVLLNNCEFGVIVY
jgi:hypothetical protein